MYTDLPIVTVIQEIDSFLIEQGLAKDTIRQYRRYGFEVFQTHFCEIGTELYSEKESWDCVLQSRRLYEDGMMSDRQFRMVRRVHEMMKAFALTGEIHYFDLDFWSIQNPCHSLQRVLDEYLHHREKCGCSELTVRCEKSEVRNFLLYAEREGKVDCGSWTPDLVDEYVVVLQEKWLSGLMGPLCILRNFLRYCSESGRTQSDLSHILDVKAATKTRVKQGFSSDEIQRLLLSIDRSTHLGKRNYAMIVLAVHTGLRQIDVLNLKLNDIHWREAEIHIVQHKTKRQVILPLDQETGDAIADYLLNSRPKSTSNFVFLRTIAPYKNLKVGSCIGSRMVQKYAALANVSWKKSERKGFHSFRRSLGREMLEKDVPLNTISEVLGHAQRNSTKPYLAIDVVHLRDCAISLDGIECSKEVFQ